MPPFLSIVTRCNQRPQGLYANVGSVATQTDTDVEHVFVWDGQSRGVPWASMQLGKTADRVRGQYVMVLDDDDMFAAEDAVETIRKAASGKPDMLVWRMDHGSELGILPGADVWLGEPRQGRIGMSCWAVAADVWIGLADQWVEAYDADYQWLAAVWYETMDRVWIDRVLTKCQNGRSIGEIEG